MREERVLSIQSHVCSGYVGNRAATFPLQLLGFEVDAVNTVNFSNHTGYGRVGGSKMSVDDLTSIFSVMERNGLLVPTRLLTGYVPGATALNEVYRLAKRLRGQFPSLIYLLDPVMGDEGKMYVSEDVIPIYRELLPLSTIITPNYFEIEVLTKITLDSVASIRNALRILHQEYKVPHVAMSSIPLDGPLLSNLPSWLKDKMIPDESVQQSGFLLCIASSIGTKSIISTVHAMVIPRIKGYFVGVGDFFSAMILGHYYREGQSIDREHALAHAVTKACQITYALLCRTHHRSSVPPLEHTDDELDAVDIERRVRRMKARELCIIQEQRLITEPSETGHLLECMSEWQGFWDN